MQEPDTTNSSNLTKSDEVNLDFEFTENEIKELDARRESRINNKSSTYSWEEARKIITSVRKPK